MSQDTIGCERHTLAIFSSVLIGICVLFGCISTVHGQTPDLAPGSSGAVVPVVSFDFEHPGVDPTHYDIAVDSMGDATYRSEAPAKEGQAPGDPYVLKFTVSGPTRNKIFALARQANFFNGKFDYVKTNVARTGVKTLTYTEGHLPNDLSHPDKGQKNQTTYNWSENAAIQELTRIFQGISTTLEFGQRLSFKRRFDKLGLDAELKRMQEMEKAGQLSEVQAVAPILTNIMTDVSLMHIDRELAKQILSDAGSK
jgi:hypothetical protein